MQRNSISFIRIHKSFILLMNTYEDTSESNLCIQNTLYLQICKYNGYLNQGVWRELKRSSPWLCNITFHSHCNELSFHHLGETQKGNISIEVVDNLGARRRPTVTKKGHSSFASINCHYIVNLRTPWNLYVYY